MTVHDVYGTTACTAAELAQIVAGRLGLAFIEHDSYYRGVYLVADAGQSRVEIQPNAIPGDDGQDDLYAPEQPKVQTLLLVTGPHRDNALAASLNSIEALVLLTQQTS